MSRKRSYKSVVSLALIITFLISSFEFLAMVNIVHAPSGLYLKWVANIGVDTHLGALAARLVSGGKELDVVVTGVSQIDQALTNGKVVVLNGTNGNVLWQTSPGNIGDHSPFEIGDLNNDGKQEIIVSQENEGGTLALYGNNGSTYWKNNAAPSYDVSPVLADVNGDGYLEVFVCSGEGPYKGVDYTTELTHNGQIVAQVNTSWHPCFGGLSIVDPKSDGHFILLQGDRSVSYNPGGDPYKYGGWGVHAMDAQTLKMLWNDSDPLCSSSIPMLADVDGDGIPDVVIAWQSRGLAVYNIIDGSVLTTGGIYRKSSNLNVNMSSHSQPTIYTDQNGDPQLITCQDTYPKIWNLRTWSLTATINVSVGEPPKMGRVTSDNKTDIILVEGNNVHVYNQNFQEVENFTGLNSPNEFTLVTDIDGDGYNELLLTSRSGYVYCLGTPAPASTPAPRSNVAFYSENRVGVADYVPPPGPKTPQISNPSPADGAVTVPVTLSQLTFTLKDYQQKLVNYSVTTLPNIGNGQGTNVKPGTYSVPVNSLNGGTTYAWTVNATDGTYSTIKTFSFTTNASSPTLVISSPSPANGSPGVLISLSTLSFNLTDSQGNPMNYTVTTTPNVGGGNRTSVSNGRYSVTISGLNYSTSYSWVVNAITTDGTLSNATTYTFTTAAQNGSSTLLITAPSPGDGALGVSINLSNLSFNLTNNQGKTMNYTVTTTPNIGVGIGTNVPNGAYNVPISGLNYSTSYSWVVNAITTDGTLSNATTYTFTTVQSNTTPWWDAAWNYRKSVTIDHTKVAANLINFPVLVDITDSGLAAHAQSSGNDIVFVDSTGNKLRHEIESYTSSSGHLTAWVMIPKLSSTSDTTLYMYYGNPTAKNQQNITGVWDSNFLMVQHLNETSGTQYDSTSNHNNGTTAGAVTQGTTGRIGGCDQFTGGYVSLPQVCTTTQTQFTFSAWIYAQSGARYFISEWANNQGAFLQVSGDNHLQLYVNGVMVGLSITLNQWHYVVGTYDGTTARLYLDGGSSATVSAGNPTWPTSQSMYIGDRYDHTRQFYGLIDEVRVSNIARSNSWINTEYADQNNTSTFYTIGIQEVRPTTLAPTVSNPAPADGVGGVALNPTLSVSVGDLNPMNITFLSNSTGSWQSLGNYTNVTSGVDNQTTTNLNGYGTTYWWSVQVTDGTYWTNTTFSFTTKTSPSNWWNSSWQYRMNVTIDHTILKVSSDQSNFPLLIDLTNPALATEAQAKGQDFVFVDVNNQKLDDQIESYNNSTGHLVAWVRIPLMSSTANTTVTMYYGNPTCADQQNPTGVWDSNYLMVLHLSENQTQFYDSTVNGNNGTLNGTVSQAPGKIDGSLNFTGGYVSLPQVCTTTQTQFTFSAWIYAQSGARYFISEWANNQGAFLQVSSDSQVQMYVNGVMVQESVSLNQWHYVVGTYDGATARLWVDGGSSANVNASSLTWPTSQSMYVGDRYDHTRQFNGLIDEVRVSSIARSNDWINTEYANQNDPSAFYTIGPEESFSA